MYRSKLLTITILIVVHNYYYKGCKNFMTHLSKWRSSSLLTTLLFLFSVPGKVSFVNFSNITSFGFTITWGRPVHENGDLRNYSVILSNANGTIKERKHVNISFEKVSYNNLNPGGCLDNNLIYALIYIMCHFIANIFHVHFLIFPRCLLQCDYRCC